MERACLRRATGYEVTETKREYKVGETGELELTKATEQVKHVPGDWKAVEFWLTNRAPERWSRTPTAEREAEAREERDAGVIELARVEEAAEDG